MTPTRDIVIDVQDGYKCYTKSKYILNGLNMSVPRGSIYSLLGPSGCGKTTLLSCIVGLQKLSSGFISMPSIKSPLDFAYMPQDVALEGVCTIEETFHVYGLMFGIEEEVVYQRLQHLTSLLHLPHKNRIIGTLSGGQQRRVSFAVALLNEGKTLLLDEPTVGLDPLLTNEIWEYLERTTKTEDRTVIITTHYIDEARRSDKIGFMRDGKILKEGEPKALMDQYGCSNLEDVFIILCRAQTNDQSIFSPIESQAKDNNKENSKSTYNYETELFNFSRFKAHVYKDFLWTKRNLILFLVLMTLPIYVSLLFCWIFGYYPNDLKIGFFTQEISSPTPENICSPHTYIRLGDPLLDFNNCSLLQSLSCQYYQQLQRRFDVVVYDNIESAISDARRNKIWGVIELSSNYTKALMARVNDGKDADDIDIAEAQVTTQLDMSNFVLGYHVLDQVRRALLNIVKLTAKSCNIGDRAATSPLRIMETFYNGTENVGSGGEAAPFTIAFSFYTSLTYTSSALINKASAILNRNKVIGVTFLEIVAGHLVIHIILQVVQMTSMLSIFYIPFEYTLSGSLPLVIFGLFLVNFVGIAFGILFSKIFSSNVPMLSGTVFLTFSLVLLGGILWPEEALHWTLKKIKWLFPIQPAIESLRNVIVKDFGISHPSVYFGYLSCVFWIVFITIISYFVSKMNLTNKA